MIGQFFGQALNDRRTDRRRQHVSRQSVRDQRDVAEELRGCDAAGPDRAGKTLRNIRGAWIKEQHVRCDDGRITEYQVNMMVTFVLDD